MKIKEAVTYLMFFSGNLLENVGAKNVWRIFCQRLKVGNCRTQVWRVAAAEFRIPISCNAVAMVGLVSVG
jgi:hypothetical protein